jgi:chemotaxis protein MotB
MNRSESEDGRHEIVIVRRGGHDDDEGHHGGVWKIAFADFMTAMMCFFLVMWLINAANEQTRVTIASYFNPIKLIDRSTNRRGIDDIGEGPQTSAATESNDANTDRPHGARRALSGPADNENSSNASDTIKHSDENLFADPYAVLAEIAADTDHLQNVSAKGDGGAGTAGPATGASGGPSYRDPFAPDFWSTQIETPTAQETARKSVPEGEVVTDEPPAEQRFAANAPATVPDAPPAKIDDELAEAFSQKPQPQEEAPPPEEAAKTDEEEAPPPVAEAVAQPDVKVEAAEKLATEIRAELAAAFGGAGNLQGVTVEKADGGVMISIADDMQDGMFEIGSAVPRRQLVLAMEKIGRMLAEHQGKVTINGHTDARPFSNGKYDNWRLSTARAQATYYMLVRGGLDEARVRSVAGFADRRLKQPNDPLAAVNRRIEILLDASG